MAQLSVLHVAAPAQKKNLVPVSTHALPAATRFPNTSSERDLSRNHRRRCAPSVSMRDPLHSFFPTASRARLRMLVLVLAELESGVNDRNIKLRLPIKFLQEDRPPGAKAGNVVR